MITLPNQVFFNPTTAFGIWIERQPLVYDVGAGVGLLGSKWPHIVVGFDLHDRDGYMSTVQWGDGTLYNYKPRSVVLLARPSHGWWVGEAFDQAFHCGSRPFYCGLQRNYEDDLSGYDYELVVDHAGNDGEQLLEITGTNEDHA